MKLNRKLAVFAVAFAAFIFAGTVDVHAGNKPIEVQRIIIRRGGSPGNYFAQFKLVTNVLAYGKHKVVIAGRRIKANVEEGPTFRVAKTFTKPKGRHTLIINMPYKTIT